MPEAVIRRLAEGMSSLPYRLRDVTDGLAAPGPGGISFQIAVQFGPASERIEKEERDRLGAILARMRADGLSRQIMPGQEVPSGWQIGPATNNGTRSLVSPWLRDTEEDWRALQTVMSLIYSAGRFAPNLRGAARVRVNVPGGLNEAEQEALAELVRGHEDVLFRLAADQYTGSGPRHVRALSGRSQAGGPADGLLPIDQGMAVHLAEPGSPYVDFELWTATFDEDVHQARVLVSLGLVSAARRRAKDLSRRPLVPMPPGTHAGVVQDRLSAPDTQAVYRLDSPGELAGLGSLLNEVLPHPYNQHSRASVIGLFATTPWFGGLAGRRPGPWTGLVPHGVPGLEDLVPLGRLSVALLRHGVVFFREDAVDVTEEAAVARARKVRRIRQSFGRNDAFVLDLAALRTPPARPLVVSAAGLRVLTAPQVGALLTAAGWTAAQPVLIPWFEGEAWDGWPERLSAVLGCPVYLYVGGHEIPAGAVRQADVFVPRDQFPTARRPLSSGADEVVLPTGTWARVTAEGVAGEDDSFSWPAGTNLVPFRPNLPFFEWGPGRNDWRLEEHDDRPRGFGEPGPRAVEADEILRQALDGLLPSDTLPPPDGRPVQIPGGVTGEHARRWWPQDQGRETAHADVEAVVEEIAQAFAEGREFLPYFLQDATAGLADAARGGLTFGLEIEYSFPEQLDAISSARNEAILADLRTAGLTGQTDILGYGSARKSGYSETRDGWFLERDSSVPGLELVSPIARDTPQFWVDLQTALGIIRTHGGVASAETGGHVHVGLRQFGNDVRRHTALWKLYRSFEDILVRLGTNPRLERHRGTHYARAVAEPSEGYTVIGDVIPGDRFAALNFTSVSGVGTDHVEFRVKDGSLDEGEWQAWINVVLGLTHLALRVGEDTSWQPSAPQPLGTHAGVVQQVRAAGPDGLRVFDAGWSGETVGVRSLVDKIFWRPDIKSQVLGLFQLNPWFGGLAGQEPGLDNWLVPAGLDGLEDLVPLARLDAVRSPDGVSLTPREDVDPAEAPGRLSAAAALFGRRHPAFFVRFAVHDEVPSFFGLDGKLKVLADPRTLVTLLRYLGWDPEQQPLVLIPFGSLITFAGLPWLVELATVIGRPIHMLLDSYDFRRMAAPGPRGHFQRFVTEDDTPVNIEGQDSHTGAFGWLRVLPREDFAVPADAWPAGTRWELETPQAASEPDESMDTDEEPASQAGDPMDTDEDGQAWYGGDPMAPEADQDAADTGVESNPSHGPLERSVTLGSPRFARDDEPRPHRVPMWRVPLSGVSLMHQQDKGKAPAASHAAVEGPFTYRRMTPGSAQPVEYTVDASGRLTLPSGEELAPDRWTAFGDDFVHDTGAFLRGDSGWIGRIADEETVRSLLGTDAERYRLTANAWAMHLVPQEPLKGAEAVRIPLQEFVEAYGPAGGFEVEMHGFRIVLPPGSETAEFDAVVSRPGLLTTTLDTSGGVPVLEAVTHPFRNLADSMDDGRSDLSASLAAFEHVHQQLKKARDGAHLSTVFRDSDGYNVDVTAEDLAIRHMPSSSHSLLVHHTTTVPLSGVTAMLRHVADAMRQDQPPMEAARVDALDGIRYGQDGRKRFTEWLADDALSDEVQAWDAAEVEGALTLAYTQVAAAVRAEKTHMALPKNYTAVASRVGLHGLRQALGPAPQAFLEANADTLAGAFADSLAHHMEVGPENILAEQLPLRRHFAIPQELTIRHYLDNLLLATPSAVIDPNTALNVRTHFPALDSNPVGGVARIVPPVVPLEARAYTSRSATAETLEADARTLAALSGDLYNEARALHGLPPVGKPTPLAGPRTGPESRPVGWEQSQVTSHAEHTSTSPEPLAEEPRSGGARWDSTRNSNAPQVVPNVTGDLTQRAWIAGQVGPADLVSDPAGTADAGTDVEAVRAAMAGPVPWPDSLKQVAARASWRLWRTEFAHFAETAPRTTSPDVVKRAWDRAVALVLPLELHPVLADFRHATPEYRAAVRRTAEEQLTADRTRGDTRSLADRLRRRLGLRPRLRGGIPATFEDPSLDSGSALGSSSIGEVQGQIELDFDTEPQTALTLRLELDPSTASQFAVPSHISVPTRRSTPADASGDPTNSQTGGLNLDALPRVSEIARSADTRADVVSEDGPDVGPLVSPVGDGSRLANSWAAGWEWSVGEARAWVGGVRVETERVEPSGAVVSVGELRRGLVSYDLRRVVLSGVVVRDHTVRVVLRRGGVAGVGGPEVGEVARRYRRVVDALNEQARL
ncbi:amidoligase family protein, partial [Streptomyces sp. NPDC059489]|uniref:amidoligase family protein n=1 Tax=Streptomyces sp. NPDC059489 TaxID=3346849 RepID=UPI003691201A